MRQREINDLDQPKTGSAWTSCRNQTHLAITALALSLFSAEGLTETKTVTTKFCEEVVDGLHDNSGMNNFAEVNCNRHLQSVASGEVTTAPTYRAIAWNATSVSYEIAEEIIVESLAHHKENLSVERQMSIRASAGNISGAIEIYDILFETRDSLSLTSGTASAASHLLRKGDLAGAVRLLTHAIERTTSIDWQDKQVTLLEKRAEAFKRLEEWNKALLDYERISGLNPESSFLLYSLCLTNFNLGNIERALEQCEKALENDQLQTQPRRIVLNLMTEIAHSEGNAEVATAYYQRCLALQSNNWTQLSDKVSGSMFGWGTMEIGPAPTCIASNI